MFVHHQLRDPRVVALLFLAIMNNAAVNIHKFLGSRASREGPGRPGFRSASAAPGRATELTDGSLLCIAPFFS